MNASPIPWASSLLHAATGGWSPRQNVVVLSDGANDERTVSFAASLAAARGGMLVLVNAAARSSGTPPLAESVLDERRKAAQNSLRTALDSSAEVRTRAVARVGRTVPSIAREVSEEFSAGVVVVDESESPLPMSFGRCVSARVGSSVNCEVVSVGGTHASPDVSSILVPVAGGPHSGLAVDMARCLAEKHGAWIELLHVVSEDGDERSHADAEEYVAAANERLVEFEDVDQWILEANDIAETIIDQSQYYDVTVLGAPQKHRLREFVFGSTTEDVRSSAYSTVVSVERPNGRDSLLSDWL